MTQEQTATYSEWLDAYQKVYDALPDDAQVACPNCGQRRLRLAFTGRQGVGYASLWCDACLWGIAVSRVPIPDGVSVLDPGLSEDERRTVVPNYRIVPPDDGDDDEYEEVFPAE